MADYCKVIIGVLLIVLGCIWMLLLVDKKREYIKNYETINNQKQTIDSLLNKKEN